MRYYLLIFLLLFASRGLAADINAAASKSSGVAPLSVFFNADIDRSTASVRTFHDLEYTWDFGDTSAGSWGTSGKSKNTDKGPVAAHVYETPGSYTATLTVRNSSGVVGSPQTFSVTVTNPDTVFASTATTCVSTGSDFTGCPSGAAHVTTSSLSGLSGYTDAGERVLLKRGDSWTANAQVAFPNNNGPVHIGAFGTCTSPATDTGVCSNAPTITMTDGESLIDLSNKQNWTLSDITFTAAKTVASAILGRTGVKHSLLLRVKTTGFLVPVGSEHWRYNDTDYWDGNSIASSSFTGAGQNVMYVGGERFSLMGCVVQNADTSHVVRVWQAYLSSINHNIISGSTIAPAAPAGRHALKLHGSTPYGLPNGETYVGTYAQLETISQTTARAGLGNNTEFIEVSNNVFGSSGDWPIAAGPQNGALDERVSDVIFEHNRVIADAGTIGNFPVVVSFMLWGRYFSVRNNIMDGTGGNDDYYGVSIARRGVEWAPQGSRVYNNTIYSNTNHTSSATGVAIHADATDTIVRNNLVSFPNSANDTLVLDLSSIATVSNNILTNTAFLADPTNATPLSRNYTLTESSTGAIDAGTTVPVLDDFAGGARPYNTVWDIGAYEYGATGDPTCSDGIQNGDETGVDCGGSCSACGGGNAFTVIGAGTTPIGAGTTAITP